MGFARVSTPMPEYGVYVWPCHIEIPRPATLVAFGFSANLPRSRLHFVFSADYLEGEWAGDMDIESLPVWEGVSALEDE